MKKELDKKTKLAVIYSSAAALVIILMFTVYFFTRRDGGVYKIPVYYYNASAGTLEAENHESVSAEPQILIGEAMELFFKIPRSAALSRPWPEAESFLTGYKVNGNILEVTFSSAYGGMPPADEALFRAAFIMTMTGLPDVDYVSILPEGAAAGLGYLSPEDYEINPNISPNRIARSEFILYFVNDTMDGLVKRIHISDEVDKDQEEMYIINQIINGQSDEGVYAAIPPETTVSIEVEENTCYVNLSSDIERFNGSAALAELMLYSIVNSLTENLSDVRSVQFQIDSQIVEQFYGVSLSQAFKKNDDLVAG